MNMIKVYISMLSSNFRNITAKETFTGYFFKFEILRFFLVYVLSVKLLIITTCFVIYS